MNNSKTTVPLHIVQHRHNREPCFFGVEDYQAYLHWRGEALVTEQCALHAYVLMTNHVNLLITREVGRRSRSHHRLGQTLRAIHHLPPDRHYVGQP